MADKRSTYTSIFMVIVVFFLISGFKFIYAAESIRIAVLDFEANDTSKFAAKAVSEFISTEMAKKNELTVIERTQIGAILNEQGFQQTGCTDQSCAVEMGKLLSAKKILLGTLTRTGKVLTITAKSVDVETGRIEFAESERCTKEEDLELASKILAVKLVNKITGTAYTTPLRTYQQDETRNRFAVGLFYKFGLVKNVKVPVFEANKTATVIQSLRVTSAKADFENQSIIVSPSYELTNNFGIRIDFKYMFSKFKDDTSSYDSVGTVGTGLYSVYCDGVKFNPGYGLALNAQLIYPVEGFNFYVIPGIGIDKYSFANTVGYYSYFTNPLYYTANYDLDMKLDIYSYIFKIETGFSVYVSRYVDLYFSAGIDFHLFSKLLSDIKINETNIEGNYSGTAQDQAMLENTTIKFEGNFPPEYYIQAGLVLRMF